MRIFIRKKKAEQIKAEIELKQLITKQEAELKYQQELNELEIEKARQLSEIESEKFKSVVEAIGSETIKAISMTGPELQAKLLQGLGLNSFLITDGNIPIINLFNTAKGLIGGVGEDD